MFVKGFVEAYVPFPDPLPRDDADDLRPFANRNDTFLNII